MEVIYWISPDFNETKRTGKILHNELSPQVKEITLISNAASEMLSDHVVHPVASVAV